MTDATPSPIDAQIHDRGYRTYDGPRTGLRGAIETVVFHSWQRALGLKRSFWMKIIPFGVLLMALIPAAAFIGIAAIVPDTMRELIDELTPDYASYYGFITAAIFIFASFVAPELLCTDRRSGLLGLYLASPLTRATYLIAKAISVFSLLSLVTVLPVLLLLVGYSLVGAGPDGFGDFIGTLLKIFLAGSVMAAGYTMVSLAVSATTDRKSVATAATLGILLGSGIISDILVAAGLSDWFRMFNLLALPVELVSRIHGTWGGWPPDETPTWSLWLAFAAWMFVCAVWIWNRYSHLVVRR